MRFTPTRAAAALALAFGIFGTSNSHAIQPQPFEGAVESIKPRWLPLGISKASVTVVVQLAGESVAEQQGNAGRKLDHAEKQQIKASLRARQDRLRGAIESSGGAVLAQYQAAYNGMKVRIGRDRVTELASLPGVVAVRPLQVFRPNNVRGVPLIGAPAVWEGLDKHGLHGEGVKIAIIDTGIDYTHANFGGPGTAAAYTAAHAAETAPANPAWFGPDAPRVKGGIDLVGDNYDASAEPAVIDGKPNPKLIPHPDPNPLDCNGHGSHVAGSAAGSGVTADGKTYSGKYNASTIASNSWAIGPGVAPRAQLYAVRVFGCDGSTDVTVDAIEWAVDNDMDVINMSLGSAFGSSDDPSAVASTNAARAGVIVVTSAGNSGASQYITGSPGTAAGAIATAATDPWLTLPGATITAASLTLPAVNANGYALSGTLGYTIKVIDDDPATTTVDESLGCDPAHFGTLAPGTVAVVNRGVCARVAKAIFGQKAGAAAVVMVNNASSFPPFEGPIYSNPDTGEKYEVTIPFLGVRGPAGTATSDGAKLRALNDGTGMTVVAATLDNGANYKRFASFTSGGPRTGDSGLKPDVSAPGVSLISTAVGQGDQGAALSGTSMASPHVAGVAALTRQAHRSWKVEDIKSAIVNTAAPSEVPGLRISRGGAGLVQPARSTATQVVARTRRQFDSALNFGFAELNSNFRETKSIFLRNNGNKDAVFTVAQAGAAGSPHMVQVSPSSVRVRKHSEAEVRVTLEVPTATAGNSAAFREVAGFIEFTPAIPGEGGDNGGVALRVPYYLVLRALSNVATSIGTLSGTDPSTMATVTNAGGVIAGNADFYAWGLASNPLATPVASDIRAIGVKSLPVEGSPTQRQIVFAVNTYHRWSNASTNEFDIFVDVNGDGIDDYLVAGVDFGAVTAGSFNGQMGSFVFSLHTTQATVAFFAGAPTDSSTVLLPVLSSQLCLPDPDTSDTIPNPNPCLSEANPRFTYRAESFDFLSGAFKSVAGPAKFNAWTSSISQGGIVNVAPGANSSTAISVKSAEWALTPALGLMVVTLDNKSGEKEAQLIPVTVE